MYYNKNDIKFLLGAVTHYNKDDIKFLSGVVTHYNKKISSFSPVP